VTRRRFADWDFDAIGRIEPERGRTGAYIELLPQARFRDVATAKLHAYGAGPFCRFRIARKRREPGLYVLMLDDAAVYAGECVDLEKRWGAERVWRDLASQLLSRRPADKLPDQCGGASGGEGRAQAGSLALSARRGY
jgi:hypothetical protein